MLASGTLGGAPLRVGVESDLRPVSFVNDDGQVEGFAVDLIRAIAAETGLDVVFIPIARTQLFDEFAARRVDALGSVMQADDRMATMAFSVQHLELRSMLFVRKNARPITSLEDFRSLRVAGLGNASAHRYLRRLGFEERFVPKATIREALHAVESGQADAAIATRLFGSEIIQRDRLAEVVASDFAIPDLTFGFHVAIHPEDRTRLAALNEGLARIRANGIYDRLYQHWVGPLEPRPLRFADLQPYLAPTLVGVVVLAALFLWQRRLLRSFARQAEKLRQSEERLTHVLSGSEDGFWDWDVRSNQVERSPRWAGMLGYTLAEIEPNLAAGNRLIHPEDFPAYQSQRDRVLAGEIPRYDSEYRMKSKSGEWRWVLDRGNIVDRTADGRPARMAGTHTDITQRKLTEAALIESQAMLKRSAQLLEQTQAASQIGGWETDLRTNRVFWTSESHRLHETSPEEFSPTREAVYQFFVPESRAILRAAAERAIQEGIPYELDLEIVTARQRRLQVRVSGVPEREDGKVVKLYGSCRDITAEKNTEQERESLRLKMLEAQKLESLGVLAGGIAHDFNNLLTVIMANASLVRADGGPHPERIGQIETAARRAADLCRQMLAYAGKGSLMIEQVDLGALVRDTAQLIRVSISKKAEIKFDFVPTLPAVVGDASQLRQVVMNLVINASEALGTGGGEIRFATRMARPQPPASGVTHSFNPPTGDCVCLEITDTGHGMQPATLQRIFDPFFTTKFTGRGLGLAAVLGIVRAHHGALTVESAPGRGSTFRLFLPAAKFTATPATAPSGVADLSREVTGGTILVADDESSVLRTTDSLLRHHGYRTVLAADGHEAVRQFRDHPGAIAAVLLDLTMPGLDGAEVLRVIRATEPATRVLIMSGYSEQDVVNRLRGLGDVPILRKPFTRETLLAKIHDMVAAPPA